MIFFWSITLIETGVYWFIYNKGIMKIFVYRKGFPIGMYTV